MDEKKRKLIVIEKTDKAVDEKVKEVSKPKIEHPHQTNPIYKNLANFHNEKVSDKWSIKDLLR